MVVVRVFCVILLLLGVRLRLVFIHCWAYGDIIGELKEFSVVSDLYTNKNKIVSGVIYIKIIECHGCQVIVKCSS